MPAQQLLERADVEAVGVDVHGHHRRSGGAQRLDHAHVGGRLARDHVAGPQDGAGDEREPLPGAGRDQDAVGLVAQPAFAAERRELGAQLVGALDRAVLEARERFALERLLAPPSASCSTGICSLEG